VSWNFTKQDFAAAQVFDFASVGVGVPLEMYFSADVKTMYVSTGKPGQLHQSDRSCALAAPKLVKGLAAGEGAHHLGFTKDSRYGFVQNALPNLSRLSDGAVTIAGLSKGTVSESMDTLQECGLQSEFFAAAAPVESFSRSPSVCKHSMRIAVLRLL
jgi:hypothetical protein